MARRFKKIFKRIKTNINLNPLDKTKRKKRTIMKKIIPLVFTLLIFIGGCFSNSQNDSDAASSLSKDHSHASKSETAASRKEDESTNKTLQNKLEKIDIKNIKIGEGEKKMIQDLAKRQGANIDFKKNEISVSDKEGHQVAVANEWLRNELTELIPEPTSGNITMSAMLDGQFNASVSNVKEEEYKSYVETLKKQGFKEVKQETNQEWKRFAGVKNDCLITVAYAMNVMIVDLKKQKKNKSDEESQ